MKTASLDYRVQYGIISKKFLNSIYLHIFVLICKKTTNTCGRGIVNVVFSFSPEGSLKEKGKWDSWVAQ